MSKKAGGRYTLPMEGKPKTLEDEMLIEATPGREALPHHRKAFQPKILRYALPGCVSVEAEDARQSVLGQRMCLWKRARDELAHRVPVGVIVLRKNDDVHGWIDVADVEVRFDQIHECSCRDEHRHIEGRVLYAIYRILAVLCGCDVRAGREQAFLDFMAWH